MQLGKLMSLQNYQQVKSKVILYSTNDKRMHLLCTCSSVLLRSVKFVNQ